MSPSDFGKLLKPFVFLDLVDLDGSSFGDMGLHPHSGIVEREAMPGRSTVILFDEVIGF
jgi:hypothetical protein